MDSIQAQFQIRQNALEAQDFAQDLLAWQQTMKGKSSSSSRQAQQQHPQLPVRGRAPGSVAAVPKEAQQPAMQHHAAAGAPQSSKDNSHPAAHTYKNYGKWDAFDVDAALQAAETPGSTKPAPAQPARPAATRSPQDQQQQQPPMMEPRQPNAPASAASKAAALKDQGNKLFQARYYHDAVSCYAQSIEAQPTAVAYANRAMAYLKLDKFTEAEADCSAALLLDPAYAKAWHRRGTARRQLGKLLEAACDFEEVLQLEPGNVSVQADRGQALDQHLKQQHLQQSSTWHSIPVQVVAGKQQQQQQQQQTKQPSSKTQEQQAAAAAAAPTAVGAARPVTPTGTISTRSSSSQASPEQRQAVAAAAQAAAQQLSARLASSLKAPRTGQEFEAAWRSLRGDVQLQGKYLRLLQPQQLPMLFKSTLTAQLVSSVVTAALTAMSHPEAPAAATAAGAREGAAAAAAADADAHPQQQLMPAQAVDLMEGLAAVPRFDMMAMSLSSKDKAGLRQLWQAAAEAVADERLQQRLAAVRPKYRL